MKNTQQHNEQGIRLKLDKLTKILLVNETWIEDLEFCERLKIHALLFRGCEQRAQIEAEKNAAEEEIEWLLEVIEEKNRTLKFVSIFSVAVSIFLTLLGFFVW